MAHVLQERYSDLVLAKLRKELVLKDGIVFNNDYEGSPKAGAVKIPTRDTEVTAGNYDKALGLTPGTGITTYTTLTINKDKGVNEIIDGYDAQAVPDGIVAERLDSAAYALQSAIDTDGAAVLKAEGTIFGFGVLDKDSIYAAIVDVRTAMSKANVPNDGRRYLLVTPDCYALMLKDTTNFIRQGDLAQQLVENGAIGKYAGFVLYEWNDSTDNLLFIAGHPKYATRANEFSVPVSIVDLSGDKDMIGASAVKGRMVYAHKVLRPAAIRVGYGADALTVTCAVGSTDGKTIATVSGNGTLALKYRLAPETLAVYGDSTASGFTALTSGTTEITAVEGTIIEVVAVTATTELVVGVGYGASVPLVAEEEA